MNNDKVIVAIDLGSSKISGAAARKGTDGSLEVLACAAVPSSSFIRHGAVYNLDRTADAIARLIEMLERQLDTKILQTFMGYCGKSMRSVSVVLKRNLEDGEVITSDLVDDMLAECGGLPSDNMLALSVASQEFRTDFKNVPESDPIGVACTHVEGRFQRVMIRPKLFKFLDDSFKRASLDIADSFVGPMVLADYILTEDERQRGCALVDYGADTTTVAVYKGGQLARLRVLPLGSDTITKDIMSQFQLSHEQAESLKISYGLYGLSGSDDEVVAAGEKQISLKLLGEIVEARNEEILANVINQIRESGYYDALFGGVILTGGGANLKKLGSAASQLFNGISPIRICLEQPVNVKWTDSSWDVADGTHLALAALLARGDENCCEEYQEKDMTIEPTLQEQATMVMGSLFDEDGESAQDKKDREERERRKKADQEKAAERARQKAERQSNRKSIIDEIRATFHKFFEDVQ